MVKAGRLTITEADVDPLLEGLAILGTGGGGSPEWGKAILEYDLSQRRRLEAISPEEVEDDALVVSGGIMGSVKELDEVGPAELVRRWDRDFELEKAIRTMGRWLGRRIDYIVPFEMGGLNTPVILSVGARMGIPVVDGDALGRAAPETQMTSWIGHGISLTPMPLVDALGNVVIVERASTLTYPDELGRWVVTRGGNMGANCHYPMSGKQLKASVIPHTISQALALGRALAEARKRGEGAVETVVRQLGGRLLLVGTVTAMREEAKEGFYFTQVDLVGEGKQARLVIKNEAMLLFMDGKPTVIFPDFICMLDPATGRGMMSVELEEGSRVALVGVPCHPRLREALRTEEGKRSFSPARFGYPELSYQPMEDLI